MKYIHLAISDEVAMVRLHRGKVNALNDDVVEELKSCLTDMARNEAAKAVVLTGTGTFFSFGFDIPQFMSYSKDQFTRYLTSFADLYTYLFVYPKPVIAALNGHAIAGGCMLATACDHRIMVEGRAKISLNEISFGSSVFAGSVEMLKFCVGSKNAQEILYTGAMYSAEEAQTLGLVDQTTSEARFKTAVEDTAQFLAHRSGRAFTSIKLLLRKPIADDMKKREQDSIREFVDIWYSEDTWEQLQHIKIRD